MAFLPVGVDENNKFPPAVQADLNATYGLKTDVEEKLDQASADALYAPVSLTSRLPRLRNTLVPAGDSNMDNGGGPGRTNSFRPGAAWTWAQVLSGHRLEVVRNAGVGGENSTQLLARYDTDVIAYNPGCVLLNIGTNDAGIDAVSVPLATTKANILEMLDRNAAIGAKTIICTIPPRNTRTATTRAHALPLNAWIRSLPRTRDGVIVFDQYLYMQDPAVPDNWISGYTGDGTHFKPAGGFAAGKVLAELIKREFPPLSRVSTVRGDETNLITNQGQFVGAGAGVAPTGWTLSNAATMAPYITGLVPRTDGVPGNWLEIVVPNGANFVMSRAITSQVAAGDTIQAAVEFEFSNLEASPSVYQYASFDLSIGPSYFNTQAMGHSQGSDDNHGSAARSGVLLTPPRTIQSGDTPIQAIFDIRGGGTYRFANATISKV